MSAKAFVHSVPEEEQEDVQGNAWLWFRWIKYTIYHDQWMNYYINYCRNQGGKLYQFDSTRNASGAWGSNVGCWR